jgi:hypothetical protein
MSVAGRAGVRGAANRVATRHLGSVKRPTEALVFREGLRPDDRAGRTCYRFAMTHGRSVLGGIFLAVLAGSLGCGRAGGKPDGGKGGASGGDGAAGTGGTSATDAASADQALEASASDTTPADTSDATPVDAADGDASGASDPFGGVWSGVQGNETFVFTNKNGCSMWTGSSGSTLCDLCAGTYSTSAAGITTAILKCTPVGACSVSAPHTDTGVFTLSGSGAAASITYDYNYGGGTNTFTAHRVSDATSDVCGMLDGGVGADGDAGPG